MLLSKPCSSGNLRYSYAHNRRRMWANLKTWKALISRHTPALCPLNSVSVTGIKLKEIWVVSLSLNRSYSWTGVTVTSMARCFALPQMILNQAMNFQTAKTMGMVKSTIWCILKKDEWTDNLSSTKRPERPQNITKVDDCILLSLLKKTSS